MDDKKRKALAKLRKTSVRRTRGGRRETAAPAPRLLLLLGLFLALAGVVYWRRHDFFDPPAPPERLSAPAPEFPPGPPPILAIRAPTLFVHRDEKGETYHVPLALNDDHDSRLVYPDDGTWNCAENCPDGVCDHRPAEPAFDHLYVGGSVADEDDLVALEIAPIEPQTPLRGTVVVEAGDGADCVRAWRTSKKGPKESVVSLERISYSSDDLPATLYLEGVKPGTADLTVTFTPEDGSPARVHTVRPTVVTMVESQQIRRPGDSARRRERLLVYMPWSMDFALEPAGALSSPAYRNRIVWSGDAKGQGRRISARFDPGDKPEQRRAVYAVNATIDGKLTLRKTVRVMQRMFTGTPVAESIQERRLEVESLLPVPDIAYMATRTPNERSVQYSQAWFEDNYTGSSTPDDPVRPIEQFRLQYAPKYVSQAWGFAAFYQYPFAIFVTKAAYDSGLKREDLVAITRHEIEHLRQYAAVRNPQSHWCALAESVGHANVKDIMEAEAYRTTYDVDATWRFTGGQTENFVEYYAKAVDMLTLIPRGKWRRAAIRLLRDVYLSLPEDMSEFKRSGYACRIRPPEPESAYDAHP